MRLPRCDAKHPVFQALPQHVEDHLAHLALLLFNGKPGVDDVEADLIGHGFILVEDAALKDAEALFDVAAEAEVHAGFIVFDGVASAENASDSDIERHAEIKANTGASGEVI